MDNKITIAIPYSEVIYGRVFLDCVIDDGVTKEEFLTGVLDGSIDPFPFAWEGENWDAYDAEDLEVEFARAEEIE